MARGTWGENDDGEKTDSWIWREWFDVAPGGEAVDLEDLARDAEKIGFGVIKAHPTYERMESGEAGREEVAQFVKESSSVEVMGFRPHSNDLN